MESVEDHDLVHATDIEADHATEDDVPDHAHAPEVDHDREMNGRYLKGDLKKYVSYFQSSFAISFPLTISP